MKKFFTFFISFLLVLSVKSVAQNQLYWAEGFENTTGNLNSSSALAPTTATADTADYGIWTLLGVYRTSSSGCGTYGPGHIRFLKETDGVTKNWIATPDVTAGISTVHFSTTAANKVITVQYTTGVFTDNNSAGIAGANWITVGRYKINQLCTDTAITVNQATARRIRFLNDTLIAGTGYQVDIDSVSLFSVGPVPVKFTSINANINSGVVRVSWNNEGEINTSSYFIERSSDGQNFSSIGSVKATNVSSYGWYDNAPVSGANYYRIKAVDINGVVTYSSIVKVITGSQAANIIVSPNPVKGRNLNLQLNNLTKGNYTVRIFNSNSQQVLTGTVVHNGGNSVQTLTLPNTIGKGFYSVQVRNGSISFTRTIVVE